MNDQIVLVYNLKLSKEHEIVMLLLTFVRREEIEEMEEGST